MMRASVRVLVSQPVREYVDQHHHSILRLSER